MIVVIKTFVYILAVMLWFRVIIWAAAEVKKNDSPDGINYWDLKRYPHSRDEDITDAFMRGYEKGKADRPLGEWIKPYGDNRFMCSICKCKENVPTCMGKPSVWDYCPNCGARMKGATDEQTD